MVFLGELCAFIVVRDIDMTGSGNGGIVANSSDAVGNLDRWR